MLAYRFPVLIALLSILLLLLTIFWVAWARVRYGVKAPAVSGHPTFERIYRIQMNTLEAVVLLLPVLGLAAWLGNPRIAGGLGTIWLLARIAYLLTYARNPASRGPAFTIAGLAQIALLIQAAMALFSSAPH